MASLASYRTLLSRRRFYFACATTLVLVLVMIMLIITSCIEFFGKKFHNHLPVNDGEITNLTVVALEQNNSSFTAHRAREECTQFTGLSLGKARYDNKRLLRIYDFHYTGSDWEALRERYDVCLATQTSIERMYWVTQTLEKWTAPVSLAVLVTSKEEWLILNLFICYLVSCHPRFQHQVSLHLAVPSKIDETFRLDPQWKLENMSGVIYREEQSCPEAERYLKQLLKSFPTTDPEKLKFKEVYPQNHLRNLARKTCPTPWTYSVDVDIIPRPGTADLLQKFYLGMTPCAKCAFVIPTFEVNKTAPYPETKAELVRLLKSGVARQFHGKYYAPGHKATDYPRWARTNVGEGDTQVSHEILTNATLYYEPFYVSGDDIPPYDERFLGYGYTRSTQFKEAYIAGWNFSVLTPLFSVHWGLQTAETLLSPKKNGVGRNVRYEQIKENGKLYKIVVQEMELKNKLGVY